MVRKELIHIEDNFLDSLIRINFIFRNYYLNTECIKKHDGFSLLGEFFGPYEKGKRYKLKYFKAIPFIQNEILQIIASEKCDNVDVQAYAINERDNQKLVRRENKYFLNKIKESKFFMENEVNKKIKPKFVLDRFNSFKANIIDGRLLKVLKLAMTELSLEDERGLTISEKSLYNRLFDIIKIWKKFFLTDTP
jgi:hypothetical protein